MHFILCILFKKRTPVTNLARRFPGYNTHWTLPERHKVLLMSVLFAEYDIRTWRPLEFCVYLSFDSSNSWSTVWNLVFK